MGHYTRGVAAAGDGVLFDWGVWNERMWETIKWCLLQAWTDYFVASLTPTPAVSVQCLLISSWHASPAGWCGSLT
jgi:hypothetical protein